jgi:hypothetical protein
VSHSRSPRLHGYWLNSYGIDGAYLPLAVRPEQVHDAIRALPLLGFAGANVTLPHKEAALSAVDRVTAQARRIGAVNTIIAAADGTLDGSNSDGFGFLENLRQSAPQWQPGQGAAVLLGAGGAARAVAAHWWTGVRAAPGESDAARRTARPRYRRTIKPMARIIGRPEQRRAGDARPGMKGQPPLVSTCNRCPAWSDIVYAAGAPLLAAPAPRFAIDGLGMCCIRRGPVLPPGSASSLP